MKALFIATLLATLPLSAALAQSPEPGAKTGVQIAQFDLPSLPGSEGETETVKKEEPATAPAEETPAEDEEEPVAEEEEEETAPAEEPEEFIPPPVEAETEKEDTAGPKKITIDTVIYVDYQFFDSSDAFKIKYHINMGGKANIATAVITGNAEIATEVTGYLAKWPQGQCVLDVSIAKVPYEISYRQADDEANINVKFKKEISEKWESTCTFIGGVTKPFKTEGPPEKWIETAFEKATPPLSALVAPIEAGEASSATFDITEYTVVEENLGSAKVKGTGIVTIQPETKGKEGGEERETGVETPSGFKPPSPPARVRPAVTKRTTP